MRFFLSPFILLGVLTLLHSCGSSPTLPSHDTQVVSPISFQESALEKEIIAYTNIVRAKYGKSPVSTHRGLTVISRKHSDFMSKNSNKFSLLDTHITHQGYRNRAKLAQTRFKLMSVSENVIYSSKKNNLAKHLVDSWYNSPPHKKILLGQYFSLCGVGIRQKGGETYGTMLMAEKDTEQDVFTDYQRRFF